MVAERRVEMASEREMYRVIKLLLYIFLNGICSPSELGRGLHLVKDKYASGNFGFEGKKIPRYTSWRRGHSAIFLQTRNDFSNKLSGTLEVSF